MTDKPKVLIIDDDEQFTLLVANHLRSAGYASLAAVDAMQGFMFAQREGPGLIILDINMPAGGGVSVLERLIKGVRTQMIPVIVVTARQDADIEAQVRAKGAVGFLRKPIDRERLIAAVAAALSPA
jgi:DNA-binding response OmpR family regulator